MGLLDHIIGAVERNQGNYRLPGDTSVMRVWYAPLSFGLFGLLCVFIRYYYVSSDLWSTGCLLLYVIIGFGLLPYLGSFIARFGERTLVIIAFFKIFGAPFIFLGFLTLLTFLP